MRERIVNFFMATVGLGATTVATAQPVTTVVVHGYSTDGTKGAWIEGMADAIIARGGGGGAVARYEQATGAWQVISGTLAPGDHVALIFRWLEDFEKPGPSWGFAEAAADALYAALRDPIFIDGGGAPLATIELVDGRFLHLLGHSRGTVVNSELAERFGVAGITVDHVTTFDPHPVNGTLDLPFSPDWGDPTPRLWSNVTFHDNYWRADGGFLNALDPDGFAIAGAFNTQFNESTLNSGGYTNAHSDTHLWYHGTIDLAATPCDGEVCITAAMRTAWWPSGYTDIGYAYSRIGGDVAGRPAIGPGDPPGIPGPVLSMFGGDFDQAAQAGWRFHGGNVLASIVDEGGVTFLKVGAAFGTSTTHNRFFLPADTVAIELAHRILTPDGAGMDDLLRIQLIDRDGVITELGPALDLTQPDLGWIASTTFGVPASITRDRTHRLSIVLDGGGTTDAVVGVDNLAIIIDTCPSDGDNSGTVGINDFLAVLSQWGPCLTPCSADHDYSGHVGIDDFLKVLSEWGPCP